MNDLISVIVPIYNAEKHLSQCIESIIKQTYSNLEILLINDGSSDCSEKICEDYAHQDDRIKIVHKPNGGVSSARNLGLDLAKGEYITFIDSDDFVDLKYIECMYENLKKENSDLTICGYGNYYNGTFHPQKEILPTKINVSFDDEVFNEFLLRFFRFKGYIFGSIWRVLYRKESINDKRFNTEIRVGEDLIFLLQVLFQTKSISYVDLPLYYYRLNSTSVLHSYKSQYLISQVALYREIKNIFEFIKHKNSKKIFETHCALLAYYLFTNEIKFHDRNFRKNINEIKKCELYQYFKLRNGIRIDNFKIKIKFIIIWFGIKTKLF